MRWLLVGLVGCAGPSDDGDTFRWYRAHADDRWDDARRGIVWAVSLLGASPPADGSAITVRDEDEHGVLFSLDRRGLDLPAVADADLLSPAGERDIARWILHTVHRPWTYYAATGACDTLAAHLAATSAPEPLVFAVTASLLVDEERRITLNPATGIATDVAMTVTAGDGSLADGSFAAEETEVLAWMPNGQQRFAAYDLGGALIPGHAAVGQPGNCMWCHEGEVMRAAPENPSIPGFLTTEAYLAELDRVAADVAAWRADRDSEVDWVDRQTHAEHERLVEALLRPTALRLANEWGFSEAEIREIAAEDGWTPPASALPEFPDAGYVRAEADASLGRRRPDARAAPLPGSSRAFDPEWAGAPYDNADSQPAACSSVREARRPRSAAR